MNGLAGVEARARIAAIAGLMGRLDDGSEMMGGGAIATSVEGAGNVAVIVGAAGGASIGDAAGEDAVEAESVGMVGGAAMAVNIGGGGGGAAATRIVGGAAMATTGGGCAAAGGGVAMRGAGCGAAAGAIMMVGGGTIAVSFAGAGAAGGGAVTRGAGWSVTSVGAGAGAGAGEAMITVFVGGAAMAICAVGRDIGRGDIAARAASKAVPPGIAIPIPNALKVRRTRTMPPTSFASDGRRGGRLPLREQRGRLRWLHRRPTSRWWGFGPTDSVAVPQALQ